MRPEEGENAVRADEGTEDESLFKIALKVGLNGDEYGGEGYGYGMGLDVTGVLIEVAAGSAADGGKWKLGGVLVIFVPGMC